jgi:ABC-type multidrug transport system fused ATPase/permease subunit
MYKKILRVLEIIGPFKGKTAIFLILVIVMALAEIVGISMLLPIIGLAVGGVSANSEYHKYIENIFLLLPDQNRFAILCLIYLVMILIKNIFYIACNSYARYYSLMFQKRWTMGILNKYMHADYSFVTSSKQGKLLNNLLYEPIRASKVIQQLVMIFSESVLALFIYVLLLATNYFVTLSISAVILFLVLLVKGISYRYALSVGSQKLKISQEFNIMAAENIGAIRQVKQLLIQNKIVNKFLLQMNKLVRIVTIFTIFRSSTRPVMETLVMSIVVCILIYVYYYSSIEMIEIMPVIGLFLISLQRLVPLASRIFEGRMLIASGLPSLRLVVGLFSSNIKQESLMIGKSINRLEKDIVFENVDFSYDNSSLLFNKLSFRVCKQQTTAIVGESGSGKSTIADLIYNLYSPTKGEIQVNGVDLTKVKLSEYRKLIGYVSQDTFLFHASVKQNIIMGMNGVSNEQIIEVAKKSHAHDFIMKLPDGYDTILGDRGLNISGGQRQRIAICRMLIRDPELLIFDEATSSLDKKSERLIQSSIDQLTGSKTIVIISHNLETIKNANHIIVLKDGKVVESGSYDELIKRQGVFYKMHRKQ